MRLNKLTIQGFKSFQKKQEIDFTKFSPGLYFVTGDNQVEPELEANGTGKSSAFVDAPTFLFYGKTPMKLTAGNVGSWVGKEKCSVGLLFEKNSETYVLQRTWNPNKLELAIGMGQYKTASQEEVEDLIGVGFDSFLYSIIVSQFSSKFFDLDPGPKLEVFSDILDLDKWLVYSDKAKNKRDKIADIIISLEKDIARIDGQVLSLREQLPEYEEKVEVWNEEHAQEIVKLKDSLSVLAQEINDVIIQISDDTELYVNAKGKLDDKTLDYKGLDKSIEGIEDSIEGFEKSIEVVEDSIRKIQNEMSSIKGEMQSPIKELDKFKKISGKCPYCNSKVTEKHLEEEKKKLDTAIQLLQDKWEDLEDSLAPLFADMTKKKELKEEKKKEIKQIDILKDKKNKEIKQIEDDIRSLKSEIDSAEKDKKQYLKNKAQLEEDLEEEKKKENPYFDLIKKNEENIRLLEKDKLLKNIDIGEQQQKQELYGYWIKGFKEVRLFVVEEALHEFELQINNNLQKLGLIDWSVELAVDKETKSGTVRKGFDVLVKAPHNSESRPFSCWSGGEGQRLRLAGTFGLMDLIASRKGLNWDFEVWDEPTQFLSYQGIEDLVSALGERAQELNKKIFLIDHKGLNAFGDFAGIIKIVKDKNGSRIEI